MLDVLDQIMLAITQAEDRRSEAFKTLRKGMGYCWSVAVAAHPDVGIPRMERWLACDDRGVRCVTKRNLRKKRLARAAPEWTATALVKL